MIRNIYPVLVVAIRGLGLFITGKALLGFLTMTAIAGQVVVLSQLVNATPSIVGGMLLWFFAQHIAKLMTQDLE